MLAVEEAPAVKTKIRGEIAELIYDLEGWSGQREVLEVLVEGPRGTGKSRALVAFLHRCAAELYPGCKILVVRKTRQSLTDSFCHTLEDDVIPEPDRPIILGDGDRSNRSHYQYPNGSRIVLAGLDKPTKYQSTDWDIIFIEEASELAWKQVEPFFGALRQFTVGMPWQLMLYATNPDAPTHWLNRRAEQGFARRVRTHHQDNPKWYVKNGDGSFSRAAEGVSFIKSLGRYTGVSKARHVLGLWKGSEGMVWDNFDPEIHVIDTPRTPDQMPNWGALGLKDYIGGMDWGFTAPGSLSVYGRDGDKRLVRVAQVYQTKRQLEWWAERVAELDQEFRLERIKCDPSRPDAIALVNDHLAKRGLPRLCEPADNKKARSTTGDLAGLDLVRWGLEKDEEGIPRIRFVKDGLRFGADKDLVEANQPLDTIQEIPGYTFARDGEGEILDDRTDPDVPDHGCDELRYVCAENWKRPEPLDPVVPRIKSGTLGDILGHAQEYKRRPRWKR